MDEQNLGFTPPQEQNDDSTPVQEAAPVEESAAATPPTQEIPPVQEAQTASQGTQTASQGAQTASQAQTTAVPPPSSFPPPVGASAPTKPNFSWFTFWICLFLCLTTLLLSSALFLAAWIKASNSNSKGTTVIYNNSAIVENTGVVIEDEQCVEAVNRTKHSVVEVEIALSKSNYEKGALYALGSGVVLSGGEGATFSYIITNNHMVEGANYFIVKTIDGLVLEAELVGKDLFTDLALLKVDKALQPVQLSSNDQIKEGMTVIAIGNPLGKLQSTKTFGKVSSLSRKVNLDGIVMTLLQHDAPTNLGNSGGGLFDIQGRLIGVGNSKTTGVGIEGLSYAIPIDTVKDVVSQIIDKGYVSGRPQLGITLLSYDDANAIYKSEYDTSYPGISEMLYYSGLYVISPEQTNPQFQFGDYIYTMDGMTVTEMEDVKAILSNYKIGDVIEVVVLRYAGTAGHYPQYVAVTLNITLTERTF